MFPGERGLLVKDCMAINGLRSPHPFEMLCRSFRQTKNRQSGINVHAFLIQSGGCPYHQRSDPARRAIFLVRQPSATDSEMAQNGTRPAKNGTTILLYTGNIMTDGGRGGFLNTTMSKNNAEVCVLFWAMLTVSW
jgi:hypothetical protein